MRLFENSNRCAASWARLAKRANCGPMRTKAASHVNGLSIQIATAKIAIVLSQTATTVHALARFGMRRNSARISGIGLPLAMSRSLGRTSGRSSAGGSMVRATSSMLHFSHT